MITKGQNRKLRSMEAKKLIDCKINISAENKQGYTGKIKRTKKVAW